VGRRAALAEIEADLELKILVLGQLGRVSIEITACLPSDNANKYGTYCAFNFERKTCGMCMFAFLFLQVWSVAFNPDGSRLVSASDDKTVAIYSCA